MLYSKALYNSHIDTLVPDGFVRVGNRCQFERTYDDKIETIFYSHRDYFPHGFYMDGVYVEIYFKDVESILSKLFDKYNIEQQTPSTFGKVFQDLKDIEYSVFETEIKDDETFERVKKVIQRITIVGVMPFFEKFNSLNEVADFLAFKSVEEIVPYIQGVSLVPKTVLILKLTNHPNFKYKLTDFHGILKEYSDREERYNAYLKLYEDLFSEDLPH